MIPPNVRMIARNSVGRRMRRIEFIRLMAIFLIVGIAFASLTEGARAQDKYCGITGIYAIARWNGLEVDFNDLVDERFISSDSGSTVLDLLEAARFCGLEGIAMENLSEMRFSQLPCPCLLHLCSDGQLFVRNHWVVLLKVEETGATIVGQDGNPIERDISRILPAWNGVALLFVRNMSAIEICETSERSARIGLYCLSFAGLLWIASSRWPCLATLVTVSVALSLAVFTRSDRIHDTIPFIHGAMTNSAFEHIDAPDLDILIAQGRPGVDLFLVDSRHERDYLQGHIQGAYSIPHNVSNSDLVSRTSRIPRNAIVVVYCQSENCEFDRFLAIRILGEGFPSVKLLKNGWVGWQKYKGSRP